MSGLLMKDFSLLFERKQTFIIFIVVCLFMGFSTDGNFIVGYMAFLGAIIALSTISYDDADNGMMFLLTLPIDRKTYVFSKYVLGAITCGISCLIAVVLMIVANALKGFPVDLISNIYDSLIFLPMPILILDFTIPLQLKFGAEKSRVMMIIIFGGITALVLVMSKLFDSSSIEKFFKFLDGLSNLMLLIISLVLCIILTLVSIAVSRRIMEKKTF